MFEDAMTLSFVQEKKLKNSAKKNLIPGQAVPKSRG
jgi:hypothetical protein